MDRYLFLDIDGVTWGFGHGMFWSTGAKPMHKVLPIITADQQLFANSNDTHILHPLVREFDPYKVGMLAEIVNSSGVKVVLSSSWRLHFTMQEVDMFMNWANPSWKLGSIISITPTEDASGFKLPTRAHEIQLWLNQLPASALCAFAIVDDIDDGMTHLFPEQFVHTDPDNGLLHKDALSIMKALGLRKCGKLTFAVRGS